MEYKYAIQFKSTGQVIDYCNTPEQAEFWLNEHDTEMVEIAKATKLSVTYTELSGPWGYGHQEESFATYGGIKRCIINLINWVKSEASVWGPDIRDIKDYFRHCSLYINNENKTQWLLNQIDKIDITMTLSQGYRMAQAAQYRQPCLDYPYLGIPDEDEDEVLTRINQ